MNTPVEVLLSTYNGERYLRQQVDSILAQEHIDVRLTVRDDGSSDGTLDVLRTYGDDDRLRVMAEQNVGVPASYLLLLRASPGRAPFFALADQDDVWLPSKLSRAVAMLEREPEGEPALYCARAVVTDETLAPIGLLPVPRRGLSFANALIQNVVTGCTIVGNAALRDLVAAAPVPVEASMHDWWLYLLAEGAGTTVYDPTPVLYYRQHGGNVLGLAGSRWERAVRRVRRHFTVTPRECSRQAEDLLRLHAADLRPESLVVVRRFLDSRRSLRRRWQYAVAGEAHRQTRVDDMLFRALYLVDRV